MTPCVISQGFEVLLKNEFLLLQIAGEASSKSSVVVNPSEALRLKQ